MFWMFDPSPKYTETKLLHSPNAATPILSTLLGIVIEINPDRIKALDPIVFVVFGITTVFKFPERQNAPAPTISTPLGIIYDSAASPAA